MLKFHADYFSSWHILVITILHVALLIEERFITNQIPYLSAFSFVHEILSKEKVPN